MKPPNKRERRAQREARALQKFQRNLRQGRSSLRLANEDRERAFPGWGESWNAVRDMENRILSLTKILMTPEPGQDGLILVVMEMKEEYERQLQKLLAPLESVIPTLDDAYKVVSFQ